MKKILWVLYQPYKWIIFLPVMALSTAIFGTLAIILVFIVSPRVASFFSGVVWAKINTFITPMFVKITGKENISRDQSYIVVSNHQSHFDILAIYGFLGIDFKWIMKQELRKIPVLGIACERLGHIFINRKNHAAAIASLNAAREKLVDGTSLMFFPEGTRSVDGKLIAFKKGAFRTAVELGLPILPITINGTNKILPPKTLNLFPGEVQIIIHKPIDIKDYNAENLPLLMDRVKDTIAASLSG